MQQNSGERLIGKDLRHLRQGSLTLSGLSHHISPKFITTYDAIESVRCLKIIRSQQSECDSCFVFHSLYSAQCLWPSISRDGFSILYSNNIRYAVLEIRKCPQRLVMVQYALAYAYHGKALVRVIELCQMAKSEFLISWQLVRWQYSSSYICIAIYIRHGGRSPRRKDCVFQESACGGGCGQNVE